MLRHALGVALSALVWLQPPALLPLPSRTGPEGSPRPYGFEPPPGPQAPRTNAALARAQTNAMLYGPFPAAGLTRGVSEGTLLDSEAAAVRSLAVTRIREAGASVVRIPVDWRSTVAEDPPASFNASDPGSVDYRFAPIDAAVISAVSAGLTPLLVVSHAPGFAEASPRWPYAYPGSWAPSPAALGEFATALARRYDGSFPDPQAPGGVLPRVMLFQAWNEPNLTRYLEPQWVVEEGRWVAFSPLLYREMLNGFYSGVKSVQPSDVVVSAGVAPNGDPEGVGRMQPVRFLRALLCLSPSPSRRDGVRRTRATCLDPPHFDALAFHPLSVGDPNQPASSSFDVSLSDAVKITGLLGQAERLGTALPGGVKPVWVTELNWESAPQSSQGVPAALQAQWISRALHRLWVAGVSLVSWQFLVDPYPGVRAAKPTGGAIEYPRPAGLYSAGVGGNPESAQPKPFLRGFTFPFDPLRVNSRRVRVWAL
ncbi:MAG TPA: hypothetical protein VK680_11945, partial [Solirubrobacteraceae bacterium]|nr:hypothetical protein [Solirubrobacteraceae bacterium]